jgi:hypothetical protein
MEDNKKVCKGCGLEKDLYQFYKHKRTVDGHETKCKDCKKIYQEKNKEKIQQVKKEYVLKNKKYLNEYKKKYKELYPEKVKESNRKYNENRLNDEKRKESKKKYHYARLKNDKIYNLRCLLSGIFNKSFKRNGFTKKSKTYEILGCSFFYFKIYLESKFETWMNWENRGLYNGELNYGWDIDHIIPISSAETEDDIVRLNHYTNLQPLCSKINRDIKSNKSYLIK